MTTAQQETLWTLEARRLYPWVNGVHGSDLRVIVGQPDDVRGLTTILVTEGGEIR
jgi:hypothetical protein